MVYRRLALIVIFMVLGAPQFANASETYVRNETIGVLGEGLDAIKGVATTRERRIIDKIDLRVPIDPAPVRVRAFNEGGRPIIEVSTGYSVVSRMIVSAYIMEHMLGLDDFGEEYARYTANTYATGRLGGGRPPWKKANLSSSQEEELLNDRTFNATQLGQHVVVLWYVLAHEVAHHVLDHDYSHGMSRNRIREQEKEADAWASNALIKMGIPPAAAFPSMMYWYYLDEFGVKSESLRTHPPDLKRIRWMLQKTINKVGVWNSNDKYFKKVPEEKTINAYKRLLYHVEELISEQTTYGESTETKEFEYCMRYMYEGCLKSCQEKYGNPLSVCKSRLCVSDRSKKIWKLRCNDIVQ